MKAKEKNKSIKKESSDPVEAFVLDDESMKTFALDNTATQHTSSAPIAQSSEHSNKLFSWEQLASEENKNDFAKLFFAFDSYNLQPDQMKDLKFDIKEAKKQIKAGKTIVIEGHACHSEGSAVYNLALSEKRARHVAAEFAKAGIDPKIIKIAPRGQEMPIIKGGTRQQQAPNRRVEVFAIDK